MADLSILVTGASGLIGQRILRRLQRSQRNAVGIDISSKPGQIPVHIADLCDIHRLHGIASQEDVGSVIHCGAVSGPMVMIDNPYGIVQANIVGTANIIELARIHRMRRVVFCSSTSVYGPTDEPPAGSKGVPENAVLRPTSVYGATKVAGEQIVAAYRKQHGLDAVAVRLSWVYGPGRTTDCVIRTMIEDAHGGRQTCLEWGRDFPRQFIHVDDAVDALLTAHDAVTCPGAAYTATGGSFLTIGEVSQIVRRVLGQPEIDVQPGPDPLDDYQHRFDISAIERDLGFRPALSLEQGVDAYSQWLKVPLTREFQEKP
ncbi:NAD-dependent epimerase/dehydratase family protein [Mesorhizobium sp. ES1-4]|uniref:NAD-dependent epimerase/dehydratase family protein n=1 Tax=Mesorhizobium sp. ES1-4 TaxID=2876627 RepID=UPI001CD01275|nr:NAD(P)-dependent oxidoreductase [Mesorhizobium sp. ES1-4]MBZ9799866.1 NAD(P)-dependent oxidoreductase [Mesorhizobium sp. ES1-4]